MITIRSAEPGDWPGIQMVEAAAVATLRETYRPNEAALIYRAQHHGNLHRLVETMNGEVVGTVQYRLTNQSLRIIGLGVRSDFRRRGAAHALLGFIEEIGKKEGVDLLQLATVKETGNAAIFHRLGFEVVSEKEDEFSVSQHHVVLTDVEMEKRLR